MIRNALGIFVIATAAIASSTRTDRRVYTFRCVDERGSVRETLYAAEIEGPPDADFRVTLRDAQHQIDATFVNEPLPSGGVESRVHLRSRRSWGLSPNGLPLWEEDDQRQRVQIDADEQLDLLPFGGKGEAGLLRIEITPQTVMRSGLATEPLKIHISQLAPQGAIEVTAFRSPHWYSADATLLHNGTTEAHAAGRLFVDEGGTLAVGDVSVHITPGAVANASPWELVSMHIDGAFARGWSAVAIAGKPITVPVDDQRQLVITLRPEGEMQ